MTWIKMNPKYEWKKICRGRNKQRWFIETNESGDTYLYAYGSIDRMDHMLNNCNLFYNIWKY